jgi:hypothetical protein
MEDTFDAEFRGLFFGEGCIDVFRQGKGWLYPRIRIGMALREVATLEAIAERYGGSVRIETRQNKKNPGRVERSCQWSLTGAGALRPVCSILEQGQLPSPKRQEVRLLAEAVSLIGSRGSPRTEASKERMAAIKQELQALKK